MTPEQRLLQAIMNFDATESILTQGFVWDVAEAYMVQDWDPQGGSHFYGPFPTEVDALVWAEAHRADRAGTDLEDCEFIIHPMYKP